MSERLALPTVAELEVWDQGLHHSARSWPSVATFVFHEAVKRQAHCRVMEASWQVGRRPAHHCLSGPACGPSFSLTFPPATQKREYFNAAQFPPPLQPTASHPSQVQSCSVPAPHTCLHEVSQICSGFLFTPSVFPLIPLIYISATGTVPD